MIAMVPPEIIALVGALVVVAGLVVALYKTARSGAIAQDDLDEASKSERLRLKAERAQAEERKKNEPLR